MTTDGEELAKETEKEQPMRTKTLERSYAESIPQRTK